jgi:hypothetical protein
MSSGKQQSQKIKQIITTLNSENELKISTAISSLQTNGDPSILEPMVKLLLTDLSVKNRSEIVEFLCSLKDSRAVDEMMRIIADTNYLNLRHLLLSTLWNSKLDYSYFLPEFVEIAVDGNFMEALECLTIIENLDGTFEERHILESQLHLSDYVKDTDPKDPQKAQIMSEIALLIKDFDNMDADDIDFYND